MSNSVVVCVEGDKKWMWSRPKEYGCVLCCIIRFIMDIREKNTLDRYDLVLVQRHLSFCLADSPAINLLESANSRTTDTIRS